MGVYVCGSLAYVADGPGGLRVIDVSDPTQPEEVGHCVFPDWASSVYISDSLAYIAAGKAGLRVLDVDDPANPQEVG